MRLDYFPINEGDTIIILGANIGNATKFYSNKVGKTGLVLAVEPEHENFLKLHNRVSIYGNTRTAKFAIGDETRTGKLNIGTNRINHSTVREFDGCETQEIEIITWDDLMTQSNITEVTLAKVDVEGSEIEFLRGMTHTYPKYIIMEEHSRFAYEYKELAFMLKEKGYLWIGEGTHLYATK